MCKSRFFAFFASFLGVLKKTNAPEMLVVILLVMRCYEISLSHISQKFNSHDCKIVRCNFLLGLHIFKGLCKIYGANKTSFPGG